MLHVRSVQSTLLRIGVDLKHVHLLPIVDHVLATVLKKIWVGSYHLLLVNFLLHVRLLGSKTEKCRWLSNVNRCTLWSEISSLGDVGCSESSTEFWCLRVDAPEPFVYCLISSLFSVLLCSCMCFFYTTFLTFNSLLVFYVSLVTTKRDFCRVAELLSFFVKFSPPVLGWLSI